MIIQQISSELNNNSPFISYIAPLKEIAAYESLWNRDKSSVKSLAHLFARSSGLRPSDLVDDKELQEFYSHSQLFSNDFLKTMKMDILIPSMVDYPKRLRDAKDPVELLYYQGNLNLLETRSVAVIGTRNPTKDGLTRTRKLVKLLLDDKFTIVSGLAKGIDTQAHQTAIQNGGNTIAVIGTPLNHYYPRENRELQQFIAKEHLLVSQVPFWKYENQSYKLNRFFFTERNKTMSALSDATVIVEANEKSGTLVQARAAIDQNRKLFILNNNFENTKITWPRKLEEKGAIKVREYKDIQCILKSFPKKLIKY